MSDLNEYEQKALAELEAMHKQVITAFGKDYGPEHIRIAKTAGQIPYKAMVQFCKNHGAEPPPDYLKAATDILSGVTGRPVEITFEDDQK
jgi:hypothetical protein